MKPRWLKSKDKNDNEESEEKVKLCLSQERMIISSHTFSEEMQIRQAIKKFCAKTTKAQNPEINPC